jgi:hypothetical protein
MAAQDRKDHWEQRGLDLLAEIDGDGELSDADYLEVLDGVADSMQTAARAKRDELSRKAREE